jgi:hypothetical protein
MKGTATAQAQADRNGIPFDVFNSDIRVVPEQSVI